MLRFLTHISKNVYNIVLYTLRDNYFKGNDNLSFFDLNKIVLKNINAHILLILINLYVFVDVLIMLLIILLSINIKIMLNYLLIYLKKGAILLLQIK